MGIDTNVDELYELQSLLEQFQTSSEYLKLHVWAETESFDAAILNQCEIKEESMEEFKYLWLQYTNYKEMFLKQLDRLLSDRIINEDGKRTISTLIRILEEYHKSL